MKKTYNKLTTEAIQLLGQNAIMAGSSRFILGSGNGGAPEWND
jgi:hypothetical protein